MKNRFTPAAEKALRFARKTAGLLGHTYIGSEHLLLGLLEAEDGIASRILRSKGLCLRRLTEAVAEYAGLGAETSPTPADMTPRARRIIENAEKKTALDHAENVGSEHLLLSLLDEGESVACRMILAENISVGETRNDLTAFLTGCGEREGAAAKEGGILQKLPHLSAFGKDLTALAKRQELDPVIGREKETERILQVLSRRQKNNPCLIGEPGVGKTAVVEGLALRLAAGDVPEGLKNRSVITLDLTAMIAGAKYRGEFEERLKGVLEELRKNPEILLFIDEIHILSGAGAAEGAIDAANILKPALSRGEIRLIGATTREEYRKHIEKDAALERRFQPILLAEPSEEEAFSILKGLSPRYERHHGIRISDEALRAAVELSVRYIGDRFLPDKAIDLLDEAAASLALRLSRPPAAVKEAEEALHRLTKERENAILLQNFEDAIKLREKERDMKKEYLLLREEWQKKKAETPPLLSEKEVLEVLTAISGIPLSDAEKSRRGDFLSAEERLNHTVVGQEEAVRVLLTAIRRAMAGIRSPERPMGSFLFLGKNGVGKTALAKALCETVFSEKEAFIRFDMSEYMESYSISKLIGSAPGYVGHEEGGRLTERVRRHPYSLVLFDEIEKAHPDVQNLLLQILEDGRLTDSFGRTTDFTNTVIVMTGNFLQKGTEKEKIGFLPNRQGAPKERREIEQLLRRHFSAEFLNRIDEIVLFSDLSIENMEKIAESLLANISTLMAKKKIALSFDSSVQKSLAARALEKDEGARPLRRLVTRLVETPVSDALLSGEIAAGDKVIGKMENDVFTLVKASDAEENEDTVAFRDRAPVSLV